MSTMFTKSPSLAIAQESARLTDLIMARLCRQLSDLGFQRMTPSALRFLSRLDCSDEIASDLARELNVSRQRIAKTVQEMKSAGYVIQSAGPGKQKPLSLSAQGREVTHTARHLFAELDRYLKGASPELDLEQLQENLRQLNALMLDRTT